MGEPYGRIAARIRNARFTAVANRDARIAERTARLLGAEIWTDGYKELLAGHSAAFDAVLIHSTNRSHELHCRSAAQAGKHILVESPLCLSSEAARSVLDECGRSGVRLMVGQVARFWPSLHTVKESLDAGRLGQPGLLRIHRWESLPSRSSSELSHRAESDGGTLCELIREIDLACWLFGHRPTDVYAVGRRQPHTQLDDWDYVQLHLGFPEGGMALVDYSRTLPSGDGYYSLSMLGSAGAAYADDHHNMQLLFGVGHPSALLTGQGDKPLLSQLQEFIHAVEENREPPISGTDGLAAIQVSEAAAESIASGHVMRQAGARYEQVEPKGEAVTVTSNDE
ncbi:MAG: Gfo/Idh/MocA family oxidoreductase [Planctomycetes bacterium]|nr:Gfo/Idh/MocA family oxidoreductase [Planctomycetota bacterium]